MRSTQTGSCVTMEVFVEEDELLPVRIILEHWIPPMCRTGALCVPRKQGRQAIGEVGCDLTKIHHVPRTARAFHFHSVAVVVMIPLHGLDDEEVHREPDWTAPIGVAAKQIDGRLPRLVVDGMLAPSNLQPKRMIAMRLRDTANPVP